MQRIGRYEILQHLASGGMGKVYLARGTGIAGFERHVVVKTLEIHDSEDHPYVAMFLDEARVVGSLHHQHIAPVFELGRDDVDGRYFLVMEYVHGQTAQQVWERTVDLGAALPIDFALTVASAAASALHYTHGRQMRDGRPLSVVHRDVTMSNLMVGYDGAIKLIDFGIAKAANRQAGTQVGYVKGKVGYLAPEQIAGKAIDHRTDIFALGIVLYELTTMQRAFREQSDQATIDKIKRGVYTPPSELMPNYPRGLELIIQKALKVNPEERFQDADAFRREIEALGHRQKLILGDAAIIEVMLQLYDDRAEPWMRRRAETDLAIPMEGAGRRPDTPPSVLDDRATQPVPLSDSNPRASRASVRSLRAATEVADMMVIEVHEDVPDEPRSRRSSLVDDGKVTDPVPTIPHSQPPLQPPSKFKTGTRPAVGPGIKSTTRIVNTPLPLPRAALVSWLMAGALVAVGFVALLIVIDQIESKRAEADKPPEPPPPTKAPVKAEAPKPPPPTPAIKKVEPTKVHIVIKSTPADATVLLDGQKIGKTPFDGDVPIAHGTHALKLRKRGYQSKTWEVQLDGTEITKDTPLRPDSG
jgi:serine/threonine-protein kinase